MSSDIIVNKEVVEYINNNSSKLHPVQKKIISYNEQLGDIKRMQISLLQCHFLHLLIKSSKIKKILEIGTFTGLSTLSMSIALPDDGSITALDKNQETSEIAINFFKKADQENKIKLIIAPALESLKNLNDQKQKFDLVFIFATFLSFVFSYLTIKYFLIFVKKFSLKFFVYYRIFLALILFYIIYF